MVLLSVMALQCARRSPSTTGALHRALASISRPGGHVGRKNRFGALNASFFFIAHMGEKKLGAARKKNKTHAGQIGMKTGELPPCVQLRATCRTRERGTPPCLCVPCPFASAPGSLSGKTPQKAGHLPSPSMLRAGVRATPLAVQQAHQPADQLDSALGIPDGAAAVSGP